MQLRTIITTGRGLVEDVARLYCLTCRGMGYVLQHVGRDFDNWKEVECPDCQGFGF